MREERAQRRNIIGSSNLQLNEAQLSGRKVIDVESVHYQWDSKPLIEDFSTTIWRGDKVGIVGLNGSGKTTLLNLLLKKLEPSAGKISHGTKLEVAYFDQHRAQLDESLSVMENVSPYSDTLKSTATTATYSLTCRTFCSRRTQPAHPSPGSPAESAHASYWHASSYSRPTCWCSTSQLTTSISKPLSSSKSACLNLTARYSSSHTTAAFSTMWSPAPSHWKEMEACANTSAAATNGWSNIRQPANAGGKTAPKAGTAADAPGKPRKLSNKEREALKTLPARIEQPEQAHAELSAKMATAEYYQDSANDPAKDAQRLEQLESDTLEAYEQWESIEALAKG